MLGAARHAFAVCLLAAASVQAAPVAPSPGQPLAAPLPPAPAPSPAEPPAHPEADAAAAAAAPPMASCGGSGPDELLLTLADMPREPALRRAVCDWFRDEPWRVTFRSQGGALPRAEEPRSGQLLVTIFPVSSAAAQLNITAPGRSPDWRTARWLERVALRNGFDDVDIEVLAQTLHSTAQATLSRAHVPPPAPRAPVVTPVAGASLAQPALLASEPAALQPLRSSGGELDAPPQTTHGLPLPVHTAIGYHFHERGGEPVTHGPSLRIELDWLSRAVVLGSYVRTSLFTSPQARAEGVELGLNGLGLGAGLSASVPAARWTGRFALGSSVDLLGLDVAVVDSAATRSLGGGRPKPRFFATGEAGVSRRFERVEVGLMGMLRWQASASYYEVLDEGEPHTILRAWRVQPGAALEVAYVW